MPLFGLKPVRMLSGVSNFTTNEYVIASGATGPIFQGMLVIMDAGGGGDILPGTNTADDSVGVFQGCSYTDPTSGKPTLRTFIQEALLLRILLLKFMTIQKSFMKYSVTVH